MASRGVRPAPRPKPSGKPFPLTFTDVAPRAGLTTPVVYGEEYIKKYIVEANGPGIAFFDYDRDGWLDIFLVNGTRHEGFPRGQEPTNHLYHNNRDGTFTDVTEKAGLKHTGWGYGVCIGDYDNDGWLDLFHVTGTVHPEVEKVYPEYRFKTKRIVYENNGNGSFDEVSELCGPAVLEPHASRGCAFGDFDNDGNLDILVMNMSEPPSLLKNENRSGNHWLNVKLVGTRSNRSALGARVVVTAGGQRQIREVLSGSSYISQSDLRQHFGLGPTRKVDQVEVRWPSGQVEKVGGVEADQFVTIEEGRGLVKAERYR